MFYDFLRSVILWGKPKVFIFLCFLYFYLYLFIFPTWSPVTYPFTLHNLVVCRPGNMADTLHIPHISSHAVEKHFLYLEIIYQIHILRLRFSYTLTPSHWMFKKPAWVIYRVLGCARELWVLGKVFTFMRINWVLVILLKTW